MKCQNCGFECNENQKFCSECGHKIEPLETVFENEPIEDIAVKEQTPKFKHKKLVIISSLLVVAIFSAWIFSYFWNINNEVQKIYDEARQYFLKGDYKQTVTVISRVSSNDMKKVSKNLRSKVESLKKTSNEMISIDRKDEEESEKKKLINSGRIKLGMTKEEVKQAWGEPRKINRNVGSYGVHEQWVYSSGKYLYFENGILTSWQD